MRYVFVFGCVLASIAIAALGLAQETAPTVSESLHAVSQPTSTQAVASAAAADAKPVSSASDDVARLTRMELCANVANRQPVDSAASFPATQEKVFCFLEFGGGKKESTVTVVWKFGVQEMGRVMLPVRRYPMFRTWANKTILAQKGTWTVDVLDEKGGLIKSQAFIVE